MRSSFSDIRRFCQMTSQSFEIFVNFHPVHLKYCRLSRLSNDVKRRHKHFGSSRCSCTALHWGKEKRGKMSASSWKCDDCNFETDRQVKYTRHIQSEKHKTLQFLLASQDDIEEEILSDDDVLYTQNLVDNVTSTCQPRARSPRPVSDHDEDEGSDETMQQQEFGEELQDDESAFQYGKESEDWYPFESKAECLLYIFMNSATHHISDEVVKFVLFIMEELGVTGLPSLHQLKMKKFGDFTWEDIITKGQNEDNVPVWIVKPSTVLKLLVAHPKTSRLIERGPKESEVLSHPANARRWKEELDFPAVDDDERPVVNVPVNLFLDDTGVHKSRQWKALHCIQMQDSGLPLTERPKGANIKFLGASEKVQIMDVAKVVMEDMADMKRDGVESFDANLNQKCVVKSCVDTVVADFNMLSFCCNHLGASATKFCPRCYADSDHFMSYGIPRTPGDTIRTVDRINLKCNEKDKKILRKKKGVKEHENVFWEHINPHKDIPVGLLHLIPLGMAKHLIKNIIAVCSDQQMEKLKTHLESTCNRGIFFNFFKHLDSRQGKHFKEYLQVAPLNMLFAGVEHKYVKMVALLAVIQKKSNKLSYTHEDVDELREDIRHYHQMVNANFPALKKKVKTHLILHLIEDIAMHGPPKAYNEDAFEKNHGTVREMIFHQNQKARSRDTSAKFAQSYLCEHVITGGFFKEGEEWKQASEGILHVGESTHVVKFMGKDVPGKRSVGEITKLERQKNKHPVTKATQEDVMLMALLSLNLTTDVDLAAYNLKRGKAVTTQKKELVNSGEWVKYLNTADEVLVYLLHLLS
ncbi:uncharacterized protein [Argopecten irradians]|uniref:uncharacterized protein n=1 Tax=Argopecten irradians TaxID=31199 RepID=UPI00371B2587